MDSTVTPPFNPPLDSYLIPNAPPHMYYIPGFITADEEAYILANIPPTRWISLTHRRLQAHPSQLSQSNTLLTSRSTSLPKWLSQPLVQRISALGIFTASPHGINHCLVNEYLPGQGIMPHEDGPAYFPVVATVSLGGSCVLEITPKKKDSSSSFSPPDAVVPREDGTVRIFQAPRSLLLTTGEAYTNTLHGIAEVDVDEDLDREEVANWELLGEPCRAEIEAQGGKRERQTRVSLTFRDVLKVVDVGGKIFGKARG